jgi:hypothetical protein
MGDQALGVMRMMPRRSMRVMACRSVMMMPGDALQARCGRNGGDRSQQATHDYQKKMLHILSHPTDFWYFTAIPGTQIQC